MCPLLWLAGAVLLFVPTTPRVEMASVPLPVHAAAARERRVARYRAAEARWARRCLWAAVALLAVLAVVVVAAFELLVVVAGVVAAVAAAAAVSVDSGR